MSAAYLDRGVEHFRAVLRARNFKASKTRDAVARCALQQTGTFAAGDLVEALRDAGVHVVTVFRAMPLLELTGLVRALIMADSDAKRYEVTFERKPRPKLACTDCGSCIELRENTLDAVQLEVARKLGFELDIGAFKLHGRCKKCQRSSN